MASSLWWRFAGEPAHTHRFDPEIANGLQTKTRRGKLVVSINSNCQCLEYGPSIHQTQESKLIRLIEPARVRQEFTGVARPDF